MKNNVCRNHQCVACCYETEIPLLKEDVRCKVNLGFKEDYFEIESGGIRVLRNSDKGRCAFHDDVQCTIYANRPSGFKLYPIVFDEDLNHTVKDGLCPFGSEFTLSQVSKNELSVVYLKLIVERQGRKKNKQLGKKNKGC